MFEVGPRTNSNLVDVRAGGIDDDRCDVGVLLGKSISALAETEHVVKNEHLTRTPPTGSDTDGGNGQLLGDLSGEIVRDSFDHDCTRSGGFDRSRVL